MLLRSLCSLQVLLPAPPKSLENSVFSRLFDFSFPLSHGGRGMHHLSILVHFQNADMAVGLLFLSLTNLILLLIILAVNSCVYFLYASLPQQILRNPDRCKNHHKDSNIRKNTGNGVLHPMRKISNRQHNHADNQKVYAALLCKAP